MTDLKIKAFKDNRDSIQLPKLASDNIIPSGTSVFIGKIKSGKTNLIINLLTNPNYYKDYFDSIYLFTLSPAQALIDNLKLPTTRIATDGDPSKLQKILDRQLEIIEKNGFKKSPKILIIADDIVSENKFLNSAALRQLFFSGSHSNVTLWMTSQSYTKIPRAMRLNAESIIIFHGVTLSEIERFAEEHAPMELTKKEFVEMVKTIIKEPFNFVFANCRESDKRCKFHVNFDSIMKIK